MMGVKKDNLYRLTVHLFLLSLLESILAPVLKLLKVEEAPLIPIALKTGSEKAPPDVYIFAKTWANDLIKLTLTCLATGFYPKDVVVSLRKFTTSLPEHLLKSSGARPNEDGTYQLRKSVEIQVDKAADYDCYVTHSSIKEPVLKQWAPPRSQGSLNVFSLTAIMTAVFVLPVLFWFISFLKNAVISEPKNLKVVETTPKAVKVQWERPKGEFEVPSEENSALIEPLEPGCLYIICVVAERGRRQSYKATVKAKTSGETPVVNRALLPRSVISEPKNLKVVETTPKAVKVQWERPKGEFDRYVISASLYQRNGSVLEFEVPSEENSALIEPLEPGCLYIICVVAERGRRQSYKATVKAKTSGETPVVNHALLP